MSTPGSSMPPSTSTTRPSGPRAAVGHLVISTVTMSPGLASLLSPEGICTSMIRRRSNGTTKPQPDSSTSNRPDRIAGAALENPHDPAFGAAVGNPFDPGDDAVAVHGLIEVAAGDVDVAADVFEGPIRHDEAEAARVGGDPPDHEVHPVRQAIAIAAGLDEVTGGDELAEKALEGGALFAWNLEPLQQLAWRRRMVDLVPNQLEQLFLIKHYLELRPSPGRGPSDLFTNSRPA